MPAETPSPEFLEQAHRHFSAGCFNQTWSYLDQRDRTPADDEQMIHLAHASLWHWLQRDDVTNQNLSVGYWLLARVYALVGQPENALRYGQRCLEFSKELPPFHQGFAHEAVARAALLRNDQSLHEQHLDKARGLLEQIADREERKLLEQDLWEISANPS